MGTLQPSLDSTCEPVFWHDQRQEAFPKSNHQLSAVICCIEGHPNLVSIVSSPPFLKHLGHLEGVPQPNP